MATPHVAGGVALYLADHPDATPADVATALVGASTPDKVGDPGTGSPNKLLFVGKVDPAQQLTAPEHEGPGLERPGPSSRAQADWTMLLPWTATFTAGSGDCAGPLTGLPSVMLKWLLVERADDLPVLPRIRSGCPGGCRSRRSPCTGPRSAGSPRPWRP